MKHNFKNKRKMFLDIIKIVFQHWDSNPVHIDRGKLSPIQLHQTVN